MIRGCAGCGTSITAPALRCARCAPGRQVLLLSAPQPYRRRLGIPNDERIEAAVLVVLLALLTTLALTGWWF